MKIGDNIKSIRENEKKMKQDEMAKTLGISTKAYSNIENNITDISLSRLFEIAEIFECAPEYILNYQDKSTFTNHFNNYDGNNGVNIMYQGCTPDQIKNLKKELQESQNKEKGLKRSLGNKN